MTKTQTIKSPSFFNLCEALEIFTRSFGTEKIKSSSVTYNEEEGIYTATMEVEE
nr:MAG TPA: hypothetical protein [Caudoviricetes sp.]